MHTVLREQSVTHGTPKPASYNEAGDKEQGEDRGAHRATWVCPVAGTISHEECSGEGTLGVGEQDAGVGHYRVLSLWCHSGEDPNTRLCHHAGSHGMEQSRVGCDMMGWGARDGREQDGVKRAGTGWDA